MNSGKTSSSAIFLGSGPVAARSLELLLKHTEIEAIITKPRPPHHRGEVPALELAQAHQLKVFTVESKKQLDNLLSQQKFYSDYGILIDFGIIISQKAIDSFNLGIVNSHFSLLPKLRGADPITWSIINGNNKTGVSLMLIDQGMDTGELLAQSSLKIDQKETTASLTDKLINLSDKMLKNKLPLFLDGKIQAYSQPNQDQATYSRKLDKTDGMINWEEPAKLIERKIRAFLDWPQSRTKLGDIEVIITSARVIDSNGKPGEYKITNDELIIYAGEQSLSIQTLKPLGKKEMPVKAFLAGYKSKL